MTSPNGIEQSSAKDLTPEQIQLEIARTRSAISEDLRVLSERFNPAQLRDTARELMHDARTEANHLLQDAKTAAIESVAGAKQAAIGKLVDAKDRAIGSVRHGVDVVGQRTRRATSLTADYVSENRMLVSLLGIGAGVLMFALRNRPQLASFAGRVGQRLRPRLQLGRGLDQRNEPSYQLEEDRYALDEPPLRPRDSDVSSPFATRRPDMPEYVDDRPRAGAPRDYRGAVVAATVLAGIGLGLFLPVGRRPRRAIYRAGERVWDEAQELAHRGQELAQRGAERVQARYQQARDAREAREAL